MVSARGNLHGSYLDACRDTCSPNTLQSALDWLGPFYSTSQKHPSGSSNARNVGRNGGLGVAVWQCEGVGQWLRWRAVVRRI